MKIFSGSSNEALAEKIAKDLGCLVSAIEEHMFPDGERRVRIRENVVEEHCVIVQSTSMPVDTHYMELFFLIDGVRRSGASGITVVMPYFGYQRQDHIFRDGEAVSLEVIIKILEGLRIDRLISLDMHTSRIPDLFSSKIEVVHLSALGLFAEKIRKIITSRFERFPPHPSPLPQGRGEEPQERGNKLEEAVLVSPDMGGIRRIKMLSEHLGGMPWAAIEKNRDLVTGKLSENKIGEGSVERKKIGFIVDDMISSGGTVVEAAKLLKALGVEELYVFATHAVFSAEAPGKLEKALIKKVFVTDSVKIPEEKRFGKVEVLSVANVISEELLK